MLRLEVRRLDNSNAIRIDLGHLATRAGELYSVGELGLLSIKVDFVNRGRHGNPLLAHRGK